MKNMSEQTNINLDASNLPTMRCAHCGNFTFTASYVIKKISALISPSGKETIAPIQVFTCTACAAILPIGGNDSLDFLKDIKEEQTNQEQKMN